MEPAPGGVPGGVFPIEIMEQILRRASLETVVVSTLVCKPLYNLIKSPPFISNFLKHKLKVHSNSNEDYWLFLFRTQRRRQWYHTLDLGKEDWVMEKLVEDLPNLAKHRRISFIGASGGLVAFFDANEDEMVFWNPCLKKSHHVLYSRNRYGGDSAFDSRATFHMGLGLDISCDNYKVLIISEYNEVPFTSINRCEFELYSLGSDSFCNLEPPAFNHFGITKFVPSSPHAINIIAAQSGTNYSILSFDFSTKNFSVIPLPSNLRVWEVKSMMTYRESSLALLCGSYKTGIYDVWGMQEYPSADSWLRLFRISDTGCKIRGLIFNNSCLIERHSRVKIRDRDATQDAVEVEFEDSEVGIVSIHPDNYEWKYLAYCTGKGSSYVASFVKSLMLLNPPLVSLTD